MSGADTQTEDERQRTRTKERVKVEKTTVEEEEYCCPNCEQWFDEDEIVLVGIGPTKENEDAVEFDWDHAKMDQVCQHCAEFLWEYDGYTGIPGEISYELDHWTWREMLSAGASVAVALSPVAILLGFAFILFRGINSALETASQLNAETVAPDLVNTFVQIAPLVIILMFLVHLSTVMPRGGGL